MVLALTVWTGVALYAAVRGGMWAADAVASELLGNVWGS